MTATRSLSFSTSLIVVTCIAFVMILSGCNGPRYSITTTGGESLQQASSESVRRFDGTWDWRVHEVNEGSDWSSELTLVIHQKNEKIEGSITASAQGGRRVSFAEFVGVVVGSTAKIDWWLGRHHKADIPSDGKAVLTLVDSSLQWQLQYDGDREVWFPDKATLKPQAQPAHAKP